VTMSEPFWSRRIGRGDGDRVEAVTVKVVTVNVRLAAPAGIVTLAGTVAAAVLLLERETRAPPMGAGPLSLTLPVEGTRH